MSFYAPRGIFSNQINERFNVNVSANLPCCIYFSDTSAIKVAEGIIHIAGAAGFSIFDGEKWSPFIASNITIEVYEPNLT